MATPHTSRASKPATAAQKRYPRVLAERTGTTFTPPASSADASRQISEMEARERTSRSDRTRERRQVQADMARRGDAARYRPSDVDGYGSNARWARNQTEEDNR
jgi:hypothetical protein